MARLDSSNKAGTLRTSNATATKNKLVDKRQTEKSVLVKAISRLPAVDLDPVSVFRHGNQDGVQQDHTRDETQGKKEAAQCQDAQDFGNASGRLSNSFPLNFLIALFIGIRFGGWQLHGRFVDDHKSLRAQPLGIDGLDAAQGAGWQSSVILVCGHQQPIPKADWFGEHRRFAD
jgi:hypothetical protein